MLEQDTEKKNLKAVIRGLKHITGKSSVKLADTLLGVDTMVELQTAFLPPQIAFIGKTGVGKSSTINELFDPQPHLLVDHVEPATIFMEVRQLSLGKDRGTLSIVDCPGLGESALTDKRNVASYKEILAKSDVAVWIIKADDRTLGIDQSFVKQVLPKNLKEKLVVGINQIDKIEPGEWEREANLPSDEQVISIARKEDIVRKKFAEIGLEPFSIVSYSAKRHYRLIKLFRAMVEACPQERIPALVNSKGDIKSFFSEDSDNIETTK